MRDTDLANVLQNSNDVLKVPNVKSGQSKFDMPKVTVTLLKLLSTRLTAVRLVRYTLLVEKVEHV